MKRIILILFLILFCMPFSFAKTQKETKGLGYSGTLPDIGSFFEYKKESATFSPQTKEFVGEKDFLQAPLDDSLFVDIILKKEKPSKYVNEMLNMARIFENFRMSLNKELTIQQYNAQVNMIDLHTKKLMQNYNETSHSMSESYIWCQQINYLAKVLGNLMYDSNYYSKYMPVSNTQYSAENIEIRKQELIKELDKAIFVLKRLDE